jgi:hypothetical protein
MTTAGFDWLDALVVRFCVVSGVMAAVAILVALIATIMDAVKGARTRFAEWQRSRLPAGKPIVPTAGDVLVDLNGFVSPKDSIFIVMSPHWSMRMIPPTTWKLLLFTPEGESWIHPAVIEFGPHNINELVYIGNVTSAYRAPRRRLRPCVGFISLLAFLLLAWAPSARAAETNLTWAALSSGTGYLSHVSAEMTLGYLSTESWETNTVQSLAKSGAICRVLGHQWEEGCSAPGCLVQHLGPQRNCRVCGRVERLRQEWVESHNEGG